MVEIMENFLKALRSPEVVANLQATDVSIVSHPGSNEAGSCVKADKLVTCQHGTEQYSTEQYSTVQTAQCSPLWTWLPLPAPLASVHTPHLSQPSVECSVNNVLLVFTTTQYIR